MALWYHVYGSYEQQKLCRQIILFLHGRPVWRPVNRQSVLVSTVRHLQLLMFLPGWCWGGLDWATFATAECLCIALSLGTVCGPKSVSSSSSVMWWIGLCLLMLVANPNHDITLTAWQVKRMFINFSICCCKLSDCSKIILRYIIWFFNRLGALQQYVVKFLHLRQSCSKSLFWFTGNIYFAVLCLAAVLYCKYAYLNVILLYMNISLACNNSDTTQNALFFRRSIWKLISSQLLKKEKYIWSHQFSNNPWRVSYQFSSSHTVLSWLLDDVDNSKQQNFELCHCFHKQAISVNILVSC